MFARKQDDEAVDAPFWKQRGWTFSAVFLATALVIAAVSYFTGSGGTDDGGEAPRKAEKGPLTSHRPQEAGQAGRTAGERPKGCHTEDEDGGTPEEKSTARTDEQNTGGAGEARRKPGADGTNPSRPTSPPEDVAWKTLDRISVPTSPSAGPTRFDGPVWWCYAHTPMGAVMAAHGILTHMSSADWRTVAEQQLVPGAGRKQFISQRSTVSQQDVENQQPGVYSGFSLPSYSKKAAEVRLLIKSANGSLSGTTVSMRWDGGDWKVEPRSNGSLFSSATSAMSNGGYVKWGAA
ncbi:hypothetical protein AN217_19340 [Streptomyces qinglanensis]|uniref:DUF8175 domain-containing protein n=1 Tax=Streptomyces qinglanensis TaxID=943816 RepID=A0A1E7K6R1_9ACTN|nr:hypothetical protein [Streptomyces qinglanensis]MBE9500211.1 hypothetical protein [Streptomyces sp. GKU 257-1]OEU99610.1 hypothetical protein AN217_19340 [Streptomyces qinglanensis]OEV23587.1 hypothetical protein AN220_23365 [Streptomyces nanshensis]